MRPGLTLVEKIATRYAVGLRPGAVVRAGDFVMIRPKHVMTHDNTGAVIPKFREIWKGVMTAGGTPAIPSVGDPRQPVFAIDHDIQNRSPENLGKYAKIEAFAAEHGIDFYPAGTGISHQVMVEQGYIVPGSMVVGSDSHSNLYGALGCLGTPVVRTDAASLWAAGVTWWQCPPVARVVLTGRLRPGVTGKDIIVALCGVFNRDEVLNHAVEFAGDGAAGLTIDQRMSIANMTTEWGALAGVFGFDEAARDYLLARAAYFERGARPGVRRPGSLGGYTRDDVERWWGGQIAHGEWQTANQNGSPYAADEDAAYAIELEIDVSSVIPHVSGPNDVKKMVSLPEIESRRVRIDKAWLMSCVNARYEDLAEAARVLAGRRVAEGVQLYLAAASAETQARAQREGVWGALVASGAIELPPGCGTCIGLGAGTIRAGEVGISATNRNFDGRMGDRAGQVYLGSPAVVAASAAAGYICAAETFRDMRIEARVLSRMDAPPAAAAPVIEGFPSRLRGRMLWLDQDNLNTDGIYAGKHTYNDAMTAAEMAGVIFENYDPQLRGLARPGDVIVGGWNFGTGSSREQAATALKHFGIACVIAASFSETYKRNAFNNGVVVFECPALVRWLREEARAGEKTSLIGEVDIDYGRSTVRVAGREFGFPALSPVAQELIVAGGAEAVVRARLARQAG